MLKKLYKYEFYSLFKTVLPLYAALLGLALLNKLMFIIKIDSSIFSVVKGLSVFFYVLAIIAVGAVGFFIVIMRFYRNLLTNEGYLTFTLPFTATQHIICKLLCGAVVIVSNTAAIICSVLVLGIGTETMEEFFTYFGRYLSEVITKNSAPAFTFLVTEIVLVCLLAVLQGLLMFYAAISFGQQFKNKILGAILSYFCIYAAVQAVSMIFIFIISLFGKSLEVIEDFLNSGISAVNFFLIFMGITYLFWGTLYFLVSRHFLSKKLNLE